MKLILKPEAEAVIRDHAKMDYPHECVGALIGVDDGAQRVIEQALPLQNERADERERRYLVSAEQALKAERVADISGKMLLGFYHSHPDHPAVPSEYDRQHAAFSWYTYIIISVSEGEPQALKAWNLREDRSAFDPQEVE